jgi:S1-C subfamily serine protease
MEKTVFHFFVVVTQCLATIILIVHSADVATAQTSTKIDYWQATTVAPHHDSIVRVMLDNGSGTGVLVHVDFDKPIKDGYLGHCLTAYHVVKDDGAVGNIRVEYRNGRIAKGGRTVAFDEANDLALLWVWVPAELRPVTIAPEPIQARDSLEFIGLGGGVALECCLRHFSAHAAVSTSQNTIYSDVALLPGDSGGGVFNEHHQLVGIISGGWFWFQTNTHAEKPQSATWPGRACNLSPIHALLKKQFGAVVVPATD